LEISKQIKNYRIIHKLTQKELGEHLNVSDKTISSWETGRTYPDISMIIKLSDLFNTSLDEFLKGDNDIVKKIDMDLKLKNIYKYLLVIGSIVIVTGIIFLNKYQYKNELVDRFNPLMKMEVGYTTLPKEVTYNGGKKYSEADSKKEIPQIPDPYEDMYVVDGLFGEASILTFTGGQAPEGKNYAMVQHKGLYVRRISFISWESIPSAIRDNMSKEYEKIPENEDGDLIYGKTKHFD